jgi:phosphatidylglycerol lysyltransferase
MGAASARLRHLLAVSATISMGALAVFALCHVLHDISYRGLIDSLASMSSWVIVAALAATAIDFVVLFGNDFGALRYAGATPPVTSTLLASFCGYALGNFIGFGALSGGAVRYRIYRAVGVSQAKIARITIYIAAAFGIGAAETIGLGLAFRAREIAQLYGIPYDSLRLIAALILAATAAVLVGCALGRQRFRLGPVTIELPSSGLLLLQIAVTMVDIVVASGTLWVLLPVSGVDFPAFVVIYTAALSLGVLSHMPSGIGVFDATVLYAVGMQGSPSAFAAALVTYRTIYFLLPFALAAVLLAASELRRLLRRSASGGNGQTKSPRFPIAAPGSDR